MFPLFSQLSTIHAVRARLSLPVGLMLSFGMIALASLAGALVIPLTFVGRTTVSSMSGAWLLLLVGGWVALAAWAILFAGLLRSSRGFSTQRALYWASTCHMPLFLALALVSALYQSDTANHIYMSSPYGSVAYRPIVISYLLLAPLVAQVLRFTIRDRSSLLATLLFLVVAGGSLALRLNGIDWGLPGRFHPDEYAGKALQMRMVRDMNPHFFTNPTLMIYLIYYAQSAVWSQVNNFHLITSAFGVSIDDPRSDFLLLVAGRVISALAGVLTVGVVYETGKEILGRKASLVAASILAVSLLHVRNSHFATNDIVATFLLAASLLFSSRIATRGSLWAHYLAGLFGGLAVSTKYTCVVFVLPIFAAHFYYRRMDKNASVIKDLRQLLPSGAVALISFVAATPYSVLAFREFVAGASFQLALGAEPAPGQFQMPTMVVALAVLAQGLGLLPMIVAIVGSITLIRRNPFLFAMLVSVPVAFFFSFGSQRYFFARFLLPVLPFLSLLAGYGVVALAGRWRGRRIAIILTTLLTISVLLQGVITTVWFNVLLNQKDSRTLAADWISANTPAESTIGVEVHSLMDNPYGWGPNSTSLRGPYWAHELRGFWPENPETAERIHRGEFDYIIVTSWGRELLGRNTAVSSSEAEFYDRLNDWGTLVATFHSGRNGGDVDFAADDMYSPFWHLFDRDRPGPTVEVFRMRP